ncbi:MAG TPA: AAA family ATPase [Polyangia bacterium]|nr:AAA family ATPase [Polyangia bacterium]
MASCSQCGQDNREGARFCDNCGQSLQGAPAAGPVAAPSSRLAAHTPAHLARRILQERTSMQGERRVVTVLFADAVGSTAYGERVDAEQVYAVVQRAVALMMEAVHRYEGAITQFRGDGVMALFGAPLAHEDSARRAVLAALEMQKALIEDAVAVRARYGFDQRFRVGLHTGPVVVGTISDDLVMDYSAVGDTANLAARLEGAAEPGTVYLSEATWREVRDYIDCEALGERAVKGKTEGVRVFRAVAPRQVRSRIDAAAARGLSPFVGRGAELDQLRALFAEVEGGHGRAVLVTGPPGIGKSRLLRELRVALGDEAAWLEGHCTAIGQSSPYLPVIEVARRALGVGEGDDAADVVAAIDAAPRLGAAAPYLKFLLHAGAADEQVAQLDPLERQFRILDAIWELFQRQADDRPLVLVGEDLHWVDEQSERVLAHVVRRIGATRVLLIVTSRPGYAPRLGSGDAVPTVALAPLDERDSARIARAALDTDALPPELMERMLARAEGNPFFLEEVVRSLLEEGVLAREDGRVVLRRPLESVRIPVTIQDVILARIDRLPRPAREALQLASVIGREFTARLLERISDLGPDLPPTLAELEELELVVGTQADAEAAYMFNHALTHDVAYSTLLGERRKALHRMVAAAITELYAGRLDERWGVLAHHHEAGEDWPQALDCLLRGGAQASVDCANRVALGLYDRAVGVAERLGDEGRPGLAAALKGRGLARFVLGEPARAAADFERLHDEAQRSSDRALEGTALLYAGSMHVYGGQGGVAEERFRAALALAGDDMPGLQGAINAMLGNLLLRAGPERQPEGDACLARAMLVADQITDPVGQAFLAIMSLARKSWQGYFDEGLAASERFGPAVARGGFAAFKNQLRWARSLARAGRGEYRVALEELAAVLAVCERNGDALAMGRCLNTLGWIYGDLQDPERALTLNRRCLEVTEERDPEVAANARLNAADALITLGRWEEADEEYGRIESFVRTATGHDRRMSWRYAQHLYVNRGTLHLRRGDRGRAATCASECLDLAERSGSRKYIAAARRLGALVRQASGETTAAHAEIDAALALAREVANPAQLWTTLAAAAEIRAANGDAAGADAARAERAAVIARVAGGLDLALAAVFRASPLARA